MRIRSGDTIYTPPDEWQWLRAARDHFFTHIWMTEGVAQGGERPEAEWGPHVTYTEYPLNMKA